MELNDYKEVEYEWIIVDKNKECDRGGTKVYATSNDTTTKTNHSEQISPVKMILSIGALLNWSSTDKLSEIYLW